MSLWVVVGGQYGSEGKGKIAAFLALQNDIDICVRCGGPNSGHSFYDADGRIKILRQLPTGYVNPRTRLLIPAGALIDPVVLRGEIEAFGFEIERIGIDRSAFIIEPTDKEHEKEIGLKEKLSSTLCGVGAAQSRRVLRVSEPRLAHDVTGEFPWMGNLLTSVAEEVNAALDAEKKVLIEGTQGFGLSLYHSPHYPRTTSRDTTAAAFLSEVGVSPRRVTDIVLVLRTFPIRVAGPQAGPLKDEITWEQLRRESGYPYEITEVTTVTREMRRIGRFDWELARRAVRANGPTMIAINGLDYLNYRNRSCSYWNSVTVDAQKFVMRLESQTDVPVRLLGTGPSLKHLFHRSFHKLDQEFKVGT